MDHGAALATVPLPAMDLGQQAEEGLPGFGHVAVRRPAQELEVAHHQLALLKLERTGNSQSRPPSGTMLGCGRGLPTGSPESKHQSRATYPGDVLHPEESDDDVVVRRPGQKLHRHGPELLQARFRPVLEAGLEARDARLTLARSMLDQPPAAANPAPTGRATHGALLVGALEFKQEASKEAGMATKLRTSCLTGSLNRLRGRCVQRFHGDRKVLAGDRGQENVYTFRQEECVCVCGRLIHP